jgi:hypothetical protein
MRINTTQTDKLTIRDTEVENVEQFTYLGSIISTTLTLTHIVSACHFTSVHTSIYYFCTSAGGLESMFNSTMSMTSSLKIAEDCLKRTSSEENLAEDKSQPYEGVQIFAQTIDSGLFINRSKMTS